MLISLRDADADADDDDDGNEDDESTLPLLSISAHHLGVDLMCRSEPAR